MPLIIFDYHLASNLTSVLLAYNRVFLDSHLLNSSSIGTNYTVSSYYLLGFCMGEFFYFLFFNKKVFLIWAGSIIASQDLTSLFTKLSGKL